MLGVASSFGAQPPQQDDSLQREFANPPAGAKPRVWWHWMNGNITKEGIQLDLDWMKRVGIGGFQNFDAALYTPQVVQRRLAYMTPEWIDAMNFTVDLAQRNEMEMAIATSAGWSETGGPWVKPEDAMKKLVWSETDIEGGRPYAGKLAQPAAVAGPFQDVPMAAAFGAEGASKPKPQFYADAAIVAIPNNETVRQAPSITISNDSGKTDTALLSDGLLARGLKIKFGTPESPACIVLDYRKPASVAALSLGMSISLDFFKSPLALAVLESSSDGATYTKVSDVPSGLIEQHTISFPAVTARYFRVCFAPPPPPYTDLLDAMAPGVNTLGMFGVTKPSESVDVTELRLFATPRVNRAEEKAGFAFVPNYYEIASTVEPAPAVSPQSIVDLTGKLQPDGTLAWTPPRGRWKILRFGYSLTGKENHPATPEATGLEVDKLDGGRVKAYLDEYLGRYERAVSPQRIGAKGIRALLVDSIEVGAQNWTESLPAEFRKRRGYDVTPWLPTLAGIVVGSARQSDQFLYDFRRTIADLIAENHYGQIAQAAHARGLVQYGEALEQGRPVLGDDMEMRRHADVPMAAMWTYSAKTGTPPPFRFADIRGAASVAHIYGQNLVAAESLTSALAPWSFAPRDLKPMMDLEFVLGVNRPVIHTSVHQPLTDKVPGLTLMIFGQYFNRNETWAEQAGPWVSYMARSSYLLQQGNFAADVAYFYGEESPLTALYREQPTLDAPTANGFDFANADVVLNRLKVDGGDLVTDSGMRYKMLYLGGTSSRMTLPVLRRLRELVDQGATIAGRRPVESPGMADDPQEFARIAASLWQGGATAGGRVIDAQDANAALAAAGVAPDFDYRKPQVDSEILFLHRRLEEGDAYFLTNRRPRQEAIEASFRVTGKRPELWRAETGRSEPVSYRVENGRTIVSLDFAAYDAFFVVFREPTRVLDAKVAAAAATPLLTLPAQWKVSFQQGRGGPAGPQQMTVGSWSEQTDAAIRYFSGTASYEQALSVPAAWLRKGERVILDLGEVHELAEVVLNGRSLGIAWRPPYRVDVTDALKAGDNTLAIRVTNLWVNRLIGDAQPEVQKVTFTIFPPYRADAPLRPSGLIGPVRLERLQTSGAAAANAASCESLKTLKLADVTIDSSALVPDGDFKDASVTWMPPVRVPEHCRVQGTIRPSSDSDIKFEVWMPTSGWNGKLHGTGNGGFAGTINYFGGLVEAVQRGYAGVSTDTGHSGDSEATSWAKGHPEKLVDYAHRAIHLMTVNAKAITKAFYGEAPRHAYFTSCSNGGRQALMSAQRYPDDYDGVIAGAPANDWTGLMLGFIWNAQAQVASADSYLPATKAAAIQAAVNQQCDKVDGVADGVIGAPQACKLDDAALLCKGAPADTCLTEAQLATWNKIRRGPQNSKGVQLFPGFTPGAEVGSIPGHGWDGWIFGQTAGNSTQGRFARNFMREVVSGDPNWQYGTFDFDAGAAAVTAKYAPILNATDPDLSRFIARGGKVIMFHGWADAAVPPLNSIKYYDSVVAKVGKAKSAAAVRLFMVPGMQHCFVGPGPSSFGGIAPAVSPPDPSSDLSAALEQWVEKGVAPEQVRATKPKNPLDGVFGPAKGGVQRTGLLCAYPRRAQWNGKDSSDDAASYTCAD